MTREQEKKKERIEIQIKDHTWKCRMHFKRENMEPKT
jgi:hypothetical protein